MKKYISLKERIDHKEAFTQLGRLTVLTRPADAIGRLQHLTNVIEIHYFPFSQRILTFCLDICTCSHINKMQVGEHLASAHQTLEQGRNQVVGNAATTTFVANHLGFPRRNRRCTFDSDPHGRRCCRILPQKILKAQLKPLGFCSRSLNRLDQAYKKSLSWFFAFIFIASFLSLCINGLQFTVWTYHSSLWSILKKTDAPDWKSNAMALQSCWASI